MTQILRKSTAMCLIFSMLLSLLGGSGFLSKEIYAADTKAVNLRIINLQGDGRITEDSEFWGEESIPAAADLAISGDGVNIQNPWMLLTVPKLKTPDGHAKTSKPSFVDSENAYRTEYYEDNDNYYVLYKFRKFSGGNRYTFPFPFKFYQGKVRNNDQLPIKFDMLQGSYQTTDSSIEEFKGLTRLYESTKTYIGRAQDALINESYHKLEYANKTDDARNARVYTLESVGGRQPLVKKVEWYTRILVKS